MLLLCISRSEQAAVGNSFGGRVSRFPVIHGLWHTMLVDLTDNGQRLENVYVMLHRFARSNVPRA
jgi:hypothetical protein